MPAMPKRHAAICARWRRRAAAAEAADAMSCRHATLRAAYLLLPLCRHAATVADIDF